MEKEMSLHGKEMTPLGAVGPKTNIDRRNCERKVPMKVLCLGVGRTGTSCTFALPSFTILRSWE